MFTITDFLVTRVQIGNNLLTTGEKTILLSACDSACKNNVMFQKILDSLLLRSSAQYITSQKHKQQQNQTAL